MHPKIRSALLAGLVAHLTSLSTSEARADEPEAETEAETPSDEPEAERTITTATDPDGLSPNDKHNCGAINPFPSVNSCGGTSPDPNRNSCGAVSPGVCGAINTKKSCGAVDGCGGGYVEQGPKPQWRFNGMKFDDAEPNATIERHMMRAVSPCRKIEAHEGQAGRLVIQFTVSEGKVISAIPKTSPSPALVNCAVQQLKRMPFPAGLDGEHTFAWAVETQVPES